MSNMDDNNSRMIIGITGKDGVGKSTVADHVHENVWTQTNRYIVGAIADSLKEQLMAVTHLRKEVFYNEVLKETPIPEYNGLTPRKMMLRYGTLMKCTFGKDYFIKQFIRGIYYTEKNIIISDVRFPNEEKFIRKYPESFIIRLVRIPDNPDKQEPDVSHDELVTVDALNYDKTYTDINEILSKRGLLNANKDRRNLGLNARRFVPR